MKVEIEITCDNAAFSPTEGDGPSAEVARILRELSTKLARSPDLPDSKVKLYDVNGNHVGWLTVEGEPDWDDEDEDEDGDDD